MQSPRNLKMPIPIACCGGLMLASAAALAAPTPVVFAAAQHTATGGSCGPGPHGTSSVVADFNGDGRPDVAICDYFAGNGPRILLNNGNGTFQSPGPVVAIAPFVGTVQAGDLNGDGKADLVVTNASNIYVRLGNGDGTFTTGASYSEYQGGQEDAILADINNDGRLDLLVQLRYGVAVRLGHGDGSFGARLLVPIPSPFLSGIVLGDFNADGVADLAASDAATQSIYVLQGNGDGSFALAGTALSGLVPGTVMAGDLNGDGFDDLVAINEFSPTQNVTVMLGDGAFGFTLPTFYNGGLTPANGEMADLNGDGVPDVVAADASGSQLHVLLGDGAGGLVASGAYAAGLSPQTPVVADFDGDGRVDLATGVAGKTQSDFSGRTQLSVLFNRAP